MALVYIKYPVHAGALGLLSPSALPVDVSLELGSDLVGRGYATWATPPNQNPGAVLATVADLQAFVASGADSADTFRNSQQRGMHTDDVNPTVPRDAAYIEFFSRSRSNITRRFIKPLAVALGADYSISEQTYSTLELDLAAFAAVGCRTIIVLNPQRAGVPDEATNPAWWANGPAAFPNQVPTAGDLGRAARAKHVEIVRSFCRRTKGDARIAGISLLNEPINTDVGNTQAFTNLVLEHQEACIDAGRAEDPTRVFLVTCAWFGQTGGYTQMRPVRQRNVVYEFHWYQVFAQTHANVAGEPDYTGPYPSTVTFPPESGVGVEFSSPTFADKARMYRDMHPVIAFSRRYNEPMICTEFGHTRGTRFGNACKWHENSIEVLEENGFSWVQFGFWLAPNVWDPFLLDNSTTVLNFTTPAALNTLTGGNTSARTPFAVVSGALESNKLWRTATPARMPGVFVEETFEGTLGRLGGANGSSVQDPGMTLTLNATAAPRSGTRHMRCVHTSTVGGSEQRAGCFLENIGGAKDFLEFWFSFDLGVRQAVTAANTMTLFSITAFGEGGVGENIALRNNAGTSTWALALFNGTDNLTYQLPDLVTPVHPTDYAPRTKVSWLHSNSNARLRVWQGSKLLVDINRMPLVASASTRLWNVFYGLLNSTQVGQTLDFDNVRYSGGADLV